MAILLGILVLTLGCQETIPTYQNAQDTATSDTEKTPTLEELETELSDVEEILGLEDLNGLNQELSDLETIENQA
ncbi:MAG: hypothetical protein AABX08_01525 [Nanoarchaeota archaeon]